MAELAPAEIFAPPLKNKSSRAWGTILGWLGFVFQILIQILRGTPSWNQVLSFVGIRHPPYLSTAAVSFKPLPAEIPTDTPPPPSQPHPAETLARLTVVLDLDETLVCAYETSSLPIIVRTQAIEAGLKCFELECISIDKEVEGRQKVNHVTVFERPGLHEFLQQISEFADLVLFTAGLEGYARPLVDRIDVENRFCHRLYRPATVSTEYREHVKDLSCISKDLCRIVLVDNNPFSFLLQPSNGIPCVPFSAGQPYDEQLLRVLLPLLKLLSVQKDVRPVLYERFRMPEWFQKHGIPPSNPDLFYIMHIEDRELKFSKITHHASVTQCLGSVGGEEWFLGVAKASKLDESNAAENEGKAILSASGHYYVPPHPDDVCIFRIAGPKFLKLNKGTWHAGPLFKSKAMDFYNLELSNTNEVDHTTHDFLKKDGVVFLAED